MWSFSVVIEGYYCTVDSFLQQNSINPNHTALYRCQLFKYFRLSDGVCTDLFLKALVNYITYTWAIQPVRGVFHLEIWPVNSSLIKSDNSNRYFA
jgi:hypothetical protein